MYLAFTNSCSINPPTISKKWFSFPFYRQENWVSEYYGIITSVTKIFIESKICQLCKTCQAFTHTILFNLTIILLGGTIIIPLNRPKHCQLGKPEYKLKSNYSVSIFKHRWKPEAQKGQILSYNPRGKSEPRTIWFQSPCSHSYPGQIIFFQILKLHIKDIYILIHSYPEYL